MTMTLQDFLALALVMVSCPDRFTENQITCIADYCQSRNSKFNRQRWLLTVRGDLK